MGRPGARSALSLAPSTSHARRGAAFGVCLLLALGLPLPGCASRPPAANVDPTWSTPWRTVQTPHFAIDTDLDPEDAAAAAGRLEDLRAALTAALGLAPVAPRRLHLVVLASDPQQLRSFRGPLHHGRLSITNEPRRILSARTLFEASAPLLHDLTHELLGHGLRRAPRWLTEGLACWAETLLLAPDGTFVIGRVNRQLQPALEGFAPLRLAELWEAERAARPAERELVWRASSWAWAGALRTERPSALGELLRRLVAAEEPQAAWARVFGKVEERALERDVKAFLVGGDQLEGLRLLSPFSGPVAQKALGEADARVLAADLELLAARPEDAARRSRRALELVRAALALDSGHARARVLLVFLEDDPVGRTARLRALADERPGDATLARVLAASLLVDRAPQEAVREAHHRALALDPDSAATLNNLAWFEVTSQRPEDAFPLAERAVTLEPANPAYLDTWAAALFSHGECKSAVEVQHRALEVLPDGVDDAYRARFLEALVRYEGACPGQRRR